MKEYILHPNSQPSFSIDFEKELNNEQLQVVKSADHATLVIAGPGSGKTRTLVFRLLYLLSHGVAASNILLLTFTNKAAKEMIHRVETKAGSDARHLMAGTFHHFCHWFLRKHIDLLGFSRSFSIIDESDSEDLIKNIIQELEAPKSIPKASVIKSLISMSTISLVPLEEMLAQERYASYVDHSELIQKIEVAYIKRKKARNFLDFDDLLLFTWKILKGNEHVRTNYQRLFTHILVDEFQDTDTLQAATIELLSHPSNYLMVVGDDSQSIYSFRGANIRNMLDFEKKFNANVYRLETNYRSTPQIISIINECIKHNTQNYQKTLKAVKTQGDLPILVPSFESRQQAEFVAQRIVDLTKEGQSLNSICVLFRSAYHAAELELELAKRAIPYQLRGGIRFFEQAHVKDVLSFIRILYNPTDELAWFRLLKLFEGIGDAKAKKIVDEITSKQDPLHAFLSFKFEKRASSLDALKKIIIAVKPLGAIDEILLEFRKLFYDNYVTLSFANHEERSDELELLEQLAASYSSTETFLKELIFNEETVYATQEEKPEESLTLSTIHQAKGLEWDTVFVIGLSQGMFPVLRATTDLEEERRLFYVAISRAKKNLYLTYSLMSATYGYRMIQDKSQFVSELPKETYEEWKIKEEPQALFKRADEL